MQILRRTSNTPTDSEEKWTSDDCFSEDEWFSFRCSPPHTPFWSEGLWQWGPCFLWSLQDSGIHSNPALWWGIFQATNSRGAKPIPPNLSWAWKCSRSIPRLCFPWRCESVGEVTHERLCLLWALLLGRESNCPSLQVWGKLNETDFLSVKYPSTCLCRARRGSCSQKAGADGGTGRRESDCNLFFIHPPPESWAAVFGFKYTEMKVEFRWLSWGKFPNNSKFCISLKKLFNYTLDFSKCCVYCLVIHSF